MRLVAEERRLGALEVLWSLPVRDAEVLAGKLLAALLVYLAMLVVSAIGPAALWLMHPYPVGPVLAGYLGMALLGLVFLGCGLAASTVSESQVVAAMLTYGTLVFTWFVSSNEVALGERLDRFHDFAQGVIDLRHVAFFLALAAWFVFLALRALGTRSWRGIA
jgi:ABC-2 type transport system permease protein